MSHQFKRYAGLLAGLTLLGMVVVGTSLSAPTRQAAELPGKGFTVGAVSFFNADTPSALVAKAYLDAAKKLGFSVTAVDSGGSPATAVSAMQNFVQKKVDVIWVQLWEAKQVQAGISAARAAGIPVMGSTNNSLGGANGYRFTTDMGPASGKLLAKSILQNTKGAAAMLAIGYSPGAVARTREEGLKAALKTRKDIKLTRNELNVTDINASTTNSVNAWLGSHPKGSSPNLLIWVPASCCVTPAVTALRQADRLDVKVYGFVDGTKAVLRPIQQGYVAAAVSDDLIGLGRAAAQATLQVIKGGIKGPQKEVGLPAELVTKANVAAFAKKHPELG